MPARPTFQVARNEVIGALRQVQMESARPVNVLDGGTIPLKDLEGFDSIAAVEVIVMLEAQLQVDLGDDLFAKGGGALCVDDIANAIVATPSPRTKEVCDGTTLS